MPALRDLQRDFAAGLRGHGCAVATWACDDGVEAAARLRIYRNNSRSLFANAVGLTYRVLRRRVGEVYFGQLVHAFRGAHPSRSGDLHEVGRPFPAFLTARLAGSPYAWLAELAALEWACADAAVAADSTTAPANALTSLGPEAIAGARLAPVPSLRLVSASVPVSAVWHANQLDARAEPVDLATGPEWLRVHRVEAGIELRPLDASEFAFVAALAAGAVLSDAIDRAELPIDRLAPVLAATFADGCIAAVHPGVHAGPCCA